jgi:2-polyprenyl-3-methyl-5-hydroxy-6-metoxy-1,4-benzoquinol methylase
MDRFFARFFPHDGDAEYTHHVAIRARLAAGRRLLDLGCGRNADLDVFRREGKEVWGVDFQLHPQLVAPEWFRPLAPGGGVPFPDGYFDLVACRWVLEHVASAAAFLGEVRRLLRPGGWLVALTVNAAHYVSVVSRLAGVLPHDLKQRLALRLYHRPSHDTFPTFYRLNTAARLRREAAGAGLQLAEVSRLANPDYFGFAPLLRKTAVVADYLLEKLAPGLGKLYFVAALQRPPHAARLQAAAGPAARGAA